MTFVETIPEDDASGDVNKLYEADRATFGDVPNFTKAFSLRPGVYAAWRGLNAEIKGGMDLRRYELTTLAAARRLRSSYCTLAHGSVLVDKFLEPDALRAVVADHRTAGLDPVDVAVMDLTDKVADDASSVSEADIEGLRSLGLSDPQDLRRDRRDGRSVLLQQDARRPWRPGGRPICRSRAAAPSRAHRRAPDRRSVIAPLAFRRRSPPRPDRVDLPI
jgi:alkylhydroperoxidase family enzyme